MKGKTKNTSKSQAGGKEKQTVESEASKEAARAKAAAGRATVASTSSWTGKLPATLLQEHCQKQKWEKVTFDCKRINDGFVVTPVLGQKNPKTNEVEYVKFIPPKDLISPQPTPLEARHLAATYALHRVASFKNMRMVLPGAHKELWAKMDDLKKQCKEKDKVYAADPFLVEREKKQQRTIQSQAKNRGEAKQEQVRISNVIKSVRSTMAQENESATAEDPKKKIRFKNELIMAKEIRTKVENLIRKNQGFELLSSGELRAGRHSDGSGPEIKKALTQLGFTPSLAEEALEFSNTLSGSLEWLLTHMPEDDLPDIFVRSKHVGSSASIQTGDLKTQYAIRELCNFGYDEEIVRDTLSNSIDKYDALAKLTMNLLGPEYSNKISDCGTEDNNKKSLDLWREECESLKVLYDKCETSEDTVIVKTRDVEIVLWRSKSYPNSLPGIALQSTRKTPKYVLLDATKRAGIHALEFLGDFLLSMIVSWVEENFDTVCEKPSKLSEIAGGVTGANTNEVHSLRKASTCRNAKGSRSRIQYTKKTAAELKFDISAKNNEKNQSFRSRQSLPAWKKREKIIKIIKDSKITLITGETGSGKSTQTVQFVLDDMIARDQGQNCNIICTQPRRISAMGLAQRVADERGEKVGESVGYAIRGETKASSNTMVRFMTTGVLLRMLQQDSSALKNISHVFVDEVHEKSLDSAFLLILLKRLVSNANLKIVLMSATVDISSFKDYFGNTIGLEHIEGRTFPVSDFYLDDVIRTTGYIPRSLKGEVKSDQVGRIILSMKDKLDYELINSLVQHVNRSFDSGSVLVFMSGSAEIDACIKSIQSSDFYVLPLHASLPPNEQRRVFDPAPTGKRKVVVSTNVAETSITIPDVIAVIDSGRVKQTVYDAATNMVRLVDNFASKAELKQRRGRAGRVRSGVCYKLYTKNMEETFESHPSPEIKRTPLEQLYLAVCSMQVGDPKAFLGEAIDPPDTMALEAARNTLFQTGSVDEDGKLTALGKHISTIPADVRTSKLLILSAVFGVLDKGLTIAAALTLKSPFVSPRDQREESKAAIERFDSGCGDLVAIVSAYDTWAKMQKDLTPSKLKSWCHENFLSHQILFDMKATRRQFKDSLQEVGFLPYGRNTIPEHYNCNKHSMKLLEAIVAASLRPNLAEIVFPEKQFKSVSGGTIEQDPDARSIRYFAQNERVFVHPSSLLFGINKYQNDTSFLSFGSKMMTSKLFVSGLTPVGRYGALFFSDKISVDPFGAGVVMGDWIGFRCWPRIGILVKALQGLFNGILDSKFENPSLELENSELLKTVIMLIETEGRMLQ